MPTATKPKTKSKTVKQRLDELEAELTELKKRLPAEEPDWTQVVGIFGPEDTAAFDEAMRLGREYRESLRPKPRSAKKGSNARARH